MRRLKAVCAVFSILILSHMAVAAPPANFAGTWELDKAKSEGLQGRMADLNQTWTVVQDGKTLAVEVKYSGGAQERPPQKFNYNLDGSETTVEIGGQSPGKATMKAKWMGDGKVLEINTVRVGNFQGNEVTITIVEHWELADDGKTLKIHRKSESPQGTRESKLTLVKK